MLVRPLTPSSCLFPLAMLVRPLTPSSAASARTLLPQVMLLKNTDQANKLVNGSRGIVVSFERVVQEVTR